MDVKYAHSKQALSYKLFRKDVIQTYLETFDTKENLRLVDIVGSMGETEHYQVIVEFDNQLYFTEFEYHGRKDHPERPPIAARHTYKFHRGLYLVPVTSKRMTGTLYSLGDSRSSDRSNNFLLEDNI